MKTAALIVAAGRGTRAGPGAPKQWRPLAGARVVDWTLAAFDLPEISMRVLVIHPDDQAEVAGLTENADLRIVHGGATRSASVKAGLEALANQGFERVLIHDVARPCVEPEVIASVLAALDTHPGAAPALAVTDALWIGEDAQVTGTRDRTGLYRAQTPQGFHFDAILDAHRAHPGDAADDVEVARAHGLNVAITQGSEANLKITHPSDFDRAAQHLMRQAKGHPAMTPQMRLGTGYDVHAFEAGDHVTLCGLKIPHTSGFRAHSDGDVAMHAITDAIYGALADGDIGQHFPPSDPQWKGAASDIFLRHAVALAGERGLQIGNVDVTIICEAPKIGPHAPAMRQRLAEIMGCEVDQVSVKATTSEALGFTGRREGIAAQASALLIPLGGAAS